MAQWHSATAALVMSQHSSAQCPALSVFSLALILHKLSVTTVGRPENTNLLLVSDCSVSISPYISSSTKQKGAQEANIVRKMLGGKNGCRSCDVNREFGLSGKKLLQVLANVLIGGM